MVKTRIYDDLDDAESSSPAPKRVRRSSDEPELEPEPESKQEYESGQKSINDEAEPGLAKISSSTSPEINSHLSIHASNEGVDKSSGDSDSSDSELASHHGRVPSGIKGLYFPNSYDISPSSPAPHPSGIEGYSFPVNHDIPPPSSDRVPSGIEGYYFPNYYDVACPSSPSSSGSSSTLMGNPPTMSPEEAARLFERQYHFYDDPGAIERGDAIITEAHEILNRLQGSPTAKDKVLPLIEVAKKFPILSEDQFASNVLTVLLNEARMVPKANIKPAKVLTMDDFEPDPCAWDKDYLGTRVQAHFRSDSIPQAKPAEGSFEKIFDYYPRLQTPRPDVVFGLSADLLPNRYCAVFDKVKPEPLTKAVHHPFLAGEFKTKDRPIAEAQVQCQRTGSTLVAYYADWTDEANDKARSKPLTTLPEVDIETETSTPDHDSFCFTIAIASNCCKMHVNWREIWSNGAIFWHTNVLEQYALEYGLKSTVEKFQQHISNIIDWGVGERAAKIYEQMGALVKRKVETDDVLPPIEPKKQRTRPDELG